MSAAYLPADYQRRAVDVLEQLHDGIERKIAHTKIMADETTDASERQTCRAMAAAYRSMIDDIAVFIQREQGQ